MMSSWHIRNLYAFMLKDKYSRSAFKVYNFRDGEVRIVFEQPMPGDPRYSPEKYIPNLRLEPCNGKKTIKKTKPKVQRSKTLASKKPDKKALRQVRTMRKRGSVNPQS